MQSQFDSERLVRVEALALGMDKKLFGNGQPGLIALIERRMTLMEERLEERLVETDKRIIDLEKQRAQLIAGSVVVIFLLNFVTGSGLISLKALLGK